MATDAKVTTARGRVAAKHKHPVNQLFHDEATLGEHVADQAAAGIGSWWFLIIQSILIVIWVTINSVEFFTHKWDLYPFILSQPVVDKLRFIADAIAGTEEPPAPAEQ